MAVSLLSTLAAYIPHDRVETLIRPEHPLPRDGVALIADISGFTPLTEVLTQDLSPDQGAEELTRVLTGVFTPLIEAIHAFHGSVIKLAGDALIVWYGREPGVRRAAVIRRALTSAWRMQKAIELHGHVSGSRGIITLRMKIGLAYGSVKRFNLGLPEYGYEDVLCGYTLDRMAEAEHHAEPGEIVLDAETAAYLAGVFTISEQRQGFIVLDQLLRPARPKPWPPFDWTSELEAVLVERLAAYLPPQIYQTLAAGRTQVAELKPVVSLFVQFHGIDYDADPAVELKLQTYFATAQHVAAGYGGRLNRLITGDKGSLIHIIFGAPRAVEEQEARAVRCAFDLQRACGGLPFITMQRIGITVGRVFAGPLGSPIRHDYTTMGDSINLSSRLMQNAAADQILIEQPVRNQLGPEFEVANLGQIMVKGKAEAISVFAATGLQTPGSFKRPIYLTRPLMGRNREMAALQQQLALVSKGQGSLIMLVGEVGTGKTHMLETLRAQLTPKLAWAGGISPAYGQSLTGYLFIEVLRELIELPPEVAPEEASRHLLNFCTTFFGRSRLEATYPYLARFMALPLSSDFARQVEGLAGESLRWQIFEVFQDLLQRFLERRPLVLALDDLQWADPTSLQLIEIILPFVSSYPMILLMAMRPERESRAWALRQRILAGRPKGLLDLNLGSLDQAGAAALIAHYAPNLPEQLVSHLIEKSGGNPLFLVETIRTLQSQGLLSGEVDINSITVDTLALPDSIQGLLLAQIDRLPIETRHTLQIAAVIGKTFFHRLLAALAGETQDLSKQLAMLEANEYILPEDQTPLGPAHTFRHILIQESAYSTLLYERRRRYHRQVAESLEQIFPGHIAEQAGLLAFHYERANDLNQAIYYHLQSADQTRLLFANEEAEALYHKVLELLDRQPEPGSGSYLEQRAKIYLKIAQTRANLLDFEGAQTFYNLAFALLEQLEQAHPPDPTPRSGPERIIRLGVLEHGPTTLDPALSEMVEVSEIVNDLFEGLVELDAELNVIPAAARRWHVDQDGRRYRFELRPELSWSDGKPLTAHDFVFAWRRNLQPETEAGQAFMLYGIEGAEAFHQGLVADPETIAIQALDDVSLEICLKQPISYFPYMLAKPVAYPQPRHVIQTKGAAWANPENLVSNGPFKIAYWQQGQEIHLVRNPFYRGFMPGNLERALLYFVLPSLAHYLDNRIDWCEVGDRADLPAQYPDEVYLGQHLIVYCLEFSHQVPPFHQRLVRQAFACCVNQTELVKEVWANVPRPARGGVVPPGMSGHSPEIGLPFDPVMARDLLRQAGYNSVAALPSLTLAALPGFNSVPRYLQASWQEHLGVKVQLIEDMAYEALWTKMSRGEIQLALGGWEADCPDPDDILRLFYGTNPLNYRGWRNQQFDRLLDQAVSLTHQAARLALFHQADHLLVAEEAATVPLYYWQVYSLLRSGYRLEGSGKIIRASMLKLKNISMI